MAALQRRVNLGSIKRGKRDHCSAANRRFIAGGLENRGETSDIAECAERRNGCFATECVGVTSRNGAETIESRGGNGWSLAAGPRRSFDDGVVLVIEKPGYGEGNHRILRIAD